MQQPKRKPKKKKVGRPSFSRKDIPELFFRYYDAYKYGFWNKQEFALFLCVSRPTLDRYFKAINAKPPIISKAENKKLQKEYGIAASPGDKIAFCYLLKEMSEENAKHST